MLVFGHAGITLGAAVLLNGAVTKSYSFRKRQHRAVEDFEPPSQAFTGQNHDSCNGVSWFTSLANCIDMRLLLVASLLPDIIDKPLGTFFFRDSLSNGRIFCHTLIFLLVITLVGFYLYRAHRKTWLLVLSFGTFTHLICDQMWLTPQTLLWPVYGWTFQKHDLSYWLQNMLSALHTNPAVYVPELVGAMILVWFMLVLVRRRQFYRFIKNGQAL